MPIAVTAPELNLSDFAFWRMPFAQRHEAFAQLRALPEPPFFAEADVPGFPPGPGYRALVRHADVVEASRRPQDFSSAAGATSIIDLPTEFTEYFGSMISMDNPRHARLRRIVSRVFGQGADLDDRIRAAARRVVDGLVEHGPGDFVRLVAARMPVTVISDLLGIPAEDYDFVLDRSNTVVGAFDPDFVADPAQAPAALLTAGGELGDYIERLAADRAAHPQADLITKLVTANVDGEQLTRAELASFFILLVVAGNETTRNALSHGLVLLTDHPQQRERLLADLDALLPTAVDEIVRLTSPIVWMRRTATRDCDLNGTHLSAGEKLLLMYWSANRDEAVFDRPASFDVTRDPNPHLGFGAPGPHFCLGARLARLELVELYRELLTRVPGIRAASAPSRLESNFVEAVKRLHCEFD